MRVSKASVGQAGRGRARDLRLKAAAERRAQLDPAQVARDSRIDEATVDFEVAWDERAQAERERAIAECAAGQAIVRLMTEKVTVKDIAHLTGLELATVRRLRQIALED